MKSGVLPLTGYDSSSQWPSLFLKQGEYYISGNDPAAVWTVLGSCVTVTMHCPVLKIGGMTHSLLPYPQPGTGIPFGQTGRFVDVSIRHLFEKMISRGADTDKLEVKVFGGGNLLSVISGKPLDAKVNIGRLNAETALEVIRELGLPVTATDIGGTWGRRLVFYPSRGDVWVKKIIRRIIRAKGDFPPDHVSVKVMEHAPLAV